MHISCERNDEPVFPFKFSRKPKVFQATDISCKAISRQYSSTHLMTILRQKNMRKIKWSLKPLAHVKAHT